MLVSHKHKFIYLKTVKTAGTSVEAFFERYCRPDSGFQPSHHCDEFIGSTGIVGYRGPNRGTRTWYNHMPAGKIRALLGEDVWKSYFKFCVIRNPWEKTISAYAFKLHRDPTLNQFLRPGFFKRLKHPRYTAQQLAFLNWLRCNRLPVDRGIYTLNNNLCVDGIIRFEHLEQDIQSLCKRLSVPWDQDNLPKFKSSIRSDMMSARNLITAPADRIIRKVFSWEIDVFEYEDWRSAGKLLPLLQIH